MTRQEMKQRMYGMELVRKTVVNTENEELISLIPSDPAGDELILIFRVKPRLTVWLSKYRFNEKLGLYQYVRNSTIMY